jgi:hypothetical protein
MSGVGVHVVWVTQAPLLLQISAAFAGLGAQRSVPGEQLPTQAPFTQA